MIPFSSRRRCALQSALRLGYRKYGAQKSWIIVPWNRGRIFRTSIARDPRLRWWPAKIFGIESNGMILAAGDTNVFADAGKTGATGNKDQIISPVFLSIPKKIGCCSSCHNQAKNAVAFSSPQGKLEQACVTFFLGKKPRKNGVSSAGTTFLSDFYSRFICHCANERIFILLTCHDRIPCCHIPNPAKAFCCHITDMILLI